MAKLNSTNGIAKTDKAEIFTSEYALKKRHNTADTSIESFIDLMRSGKLKKQNDIMLACLSMYQPLTRRMASLRTDMELNSAGRCLNDLEKAGLVKAPFTAKSPDTGKRVRFYTLIDWVAEPKQQQAA